MATPTACPPRPPSPTPDQGEDPDDGLTKTEREGAAPARGRSFAYPDHRALCSRSQEFTFQNRPRYAKVVRTMYGKSDEFQARMTSHPASRAEPVERRVT